ncbi:MAG: alpha/beta hydrolase [Bryobacter sp.]|nr:alpha/beta hydrolase [Bryobacter sp.]
MSQASSASSSGVSYLERGDPSGTPLLHFHGWPSSRIEQFIPEELLREYGLRWFSLDRPGYGGTLWFAEHGFADWARRVADWAAGQNISRFHVLGFSGGGPYAMACAYYLPERVASLTLLGSLAPFGPQACPAPPPWKGWGEILLHHAPELGIAGFQVADFLRRRFPRPFEVWQVRQTDPRDQEILLAEDKLAQLEAAHAEAFRQGVRHIVHDLRLSARPWDFTPAGIAVPTFVHVGLRDRQVPPAAGLWLAETIAQAQLFRYPDEGHYLGHRQARNILEAIRNIR